MTLGCLLLVISLFIWIFIPSRIERYPYNDGYRLAFLITLTLLTLWSSSEPQKKRRHSILFSILIGYTSSLSGYIFAYSLLYSGFFSAEGASLVLERLSGSPPKYIYETMVYVLIIGDWIYGAIFWIATYLLSSIIEKQSAK